ncbi:hypothetical protein Sjap_021657 [Stephania japonica]|uniref:Disease resistance R13L4/SHOC-2-like LRR domain-containing protein n=1 Tax=Stephania japonica TaxID=461633 RepID=A0AAP0EME2_9MAGN
MKILNEIEKEFQEIKKKKENHFIKVIYYQLKCGLQQDKKNHIGAVAGASEFLSLVQEASVVDGDLLTWDFIKNFLFSYSVRVTTDCCTSWDGVTCDDFGFVIGLDVSESFYNGSIDSNSSLFNLHHLKALNLARNSFLNISFPTLIAKLCSLTYLNLSGSLIPGHIPSEISQLNNLTSLDLSYSFDYEVVPLEFSKLTNLISLRLSGLTLESPIALRTLIYNFSSLEELYLDADPTTDNKRGGIAQDWFEAVASIRTSLRVLSLPKMGLSGPMGYSILHFSFLSQLYLSGNNITHFPPEMFQLPNLEILDLSGNDHLTLSSLDFPPNKQYALQQLIVRGINFPGRSLPHSIGNLNLLTKLDASNCDLTGPISSSLSKLSQLSQLEVLDLGYNAFVGTLSSFAWSNLSNLRMLDLSGNQLTGTISSSLSKLSQLSQLEELDLGYNAFVGTLSSFAWSNLSNLRKLDLFGNQLTGTISSSLSKLSQLSQLEKLDLAMLFWYSLIICMVKPLQFAQARFVQQQARRENSIVVI